MTIFGLFILMWPLLTDDCVDLHEAQRLGKFAFTSSYLSNNYTALFI